MEAYIKEDDISDKVVYQVKQNTIKWLEAMQSRDENELVIKTKRTDVR